MNAVVLRSSIQWMWWHRYSGCNVRYSGSDIMSTTPVMSLIMWSDVIKCGCDALYSVYDVKHIGLWCHTYKGCDNIESVGVMTQIQWLWCYKYSEWDVVCNVCDIVIYNAWGLINTVGWYHQTVEVITQIQWIRCQTQWVWFHKNGVLML